MDGRQNDGAAGVHGDVDLVSNFDASEIHERGIEDDALGIANLADGLGHGVILCFTSTQTSSEQGSFAALLIAIVCSRKHVEQGLPRAIEVNRPYLRW